ncbi:MULTISPECIES: DUF6370 family protein [Amniculibacterium]|uniref:DUF6370 family protein n=1 Tax=Amniculibacterium TaxID=2715289 RepID=UPI001F14C890|nr:MULTISPECIES: DUF6370 family protein [Amniculibacterium]
MKKLVGLFLMLFSVMLFAQKKLDKQVVESGCGMCIYNMKSDKGCAIAVKIDGKPYYVEGVSKKSLGDAHADDGYCNITKKALVSGELKNNKFYATSFSFVAEEPKKK